MNQTFKADGKTPGDLEREIRTRYVPTVFKYLTVTVKQEGSTLWYYVDGEVKAPNRQLYNTRITVLKAIASASGFTDFANKKKVKVVRSGGEDTAAKQSFELNMVDILEKGKTEKDVILQPDDFIIVPSRLINF